LFLENNFCICITSILDIFDN